MGATPSSDKPREPRDSSVDKNPPSPRRSKEGYEDVATVLRALDETESSCVKPESFFRAMQERGTSFFTGVPDSLLKNFCDFVTDNTDASEHVISANEGTAVGLAAGHHLATGEVPVVYLQNSGLGNAVNPLLSPYLVKVGKMGRKLGYWIWLATQNLEDFPDAATRLLNMIEWYVCLVTPPDEVEQLARFKSLTEDQKALIRSATKAPGKYTEGVVLADRLEALFRVVPPSRYMALAGTEKEEKAERRQVMNELGCSELHAALQGSCALRAI